MRNPTCKYRKWLGIVAGALVLAAAVVLGILLLGKDSGGTQAKAAERAVLYWNVERNEYKGKGPDGDTGRMARSDGYYYIRFAVGGEQKDFAVAERTLVQKIDQLDVMGLEFDENGIVVGVKNINECTGGLVASKLFVVSVEGNTLYCNTQGMLRGQKVELTVDADTEVYDVGNTGLLCGLKGQIVVDDEIMAVRDYDGTISYIFRSGYKEPGDVYWNLDRKYDSTTGYTTREKDDAGFYVYEMALNGEVVTLRTRDMDVANAIDKKAARCTGLEFDENGMISGVTSAAAQCDGTTFASWAHVMEVNKEQVYAVKLSGSSAGTEYSGTLSKNCRIINTCGIGGERGSYTTVQYGDQVHGLTDSRGKICYLFIVSRLSGGDGYDLYWNCERQYDSTNKVTKRTPDADGYYRFAVATGGENMTVKTQDKELANKLDSYAARCFAMKIDADNNILGFQSAGSIHGGSTFGSWYYVDKIDGQNLTVSRILSGDTEPTVLEGVMASDVEIINGSAVHVSHCGEYTELKVGDRVHCLKDLDGKIRVIFVVEREVPGPVYWNITKKAVKNNITTRQREEDGYYYFDMTAGGMTMRLKTKDLGLAAKIDSVAAKCMGLSVRNGVILKYYPVSSVTGCQGGTKSESWVDVKKLSGRTYTAQKDPKSTASTAGQYFTSTMASNCKIYNVSGSYSVFCGEPTTLRVGDRIHALHNKEGLTTVIFVVERKKPLDEKDNCPCKADVTWQAWDGTTKLENGKYYYLTADVIAPSEGFMLEGIGVSLRLDGHTISSPGRCFYLKGGAKLNICDHDTRGKLIGSGIDGESDGVIRVFNAGDTVNLWNIDVEYVAGTGTPKEGGLLSVSGTASVYNCNLTGGTTSGVGGNVRVNSTGTFRMFGGKLTGGKGSSGGNAYISGRTYLEDAVSENGNLVFNAETDMVVKNLTADTALLNKGSTKLQGVITIGNLTVKDGKMIDGGIAELSDILVTCKPEKSQVIMTGASETAFKALRSFKPDDYVLSYNASKKTVTVTCTIVPQTHENSHCACLGNAQGVGDHTCSELTGWTELNADILVDSPTSGNLAFPESGNYYLSLDLELSKSIDILPGQEINLCLNSCDIVGSKRIFRVNGTLNLTDCTGNGKVVGSAALAPVFYTYAGGTMNLFGGTLATSYTGTASTWGGVGAVANDAGNAANKGGSVFNMYGGTIQGGKVHAAADGKNGRGGAVMIMAATSTEQVFNMYGGTIAGGWAEAGGSAVCASGVNAVANLLGGSITTDGESGGEVYAMTQSEITLGGSVQVDTLRLGDGVELKLQDLQKDGAPMGVLMDNTGVFAQSQEDLSGRFTSVDDTYQVVYRDGVLELDLNAATGHVHCLCGGIAEGVHTHKCKNLLYEAWESGDSLPTTSGNYYLTQDVVLTDAQGFLVGNNQINLCLNGFNITNNTGRAFYLKNGGDVLNVCNHGDRGGVIGAVGVAGESGGVVRISVGGASFGAYNVTLRLIDEENRTAVTEGGTINCSGKLELYGCTVENGYSSKGGNINLVLVAKANIVNSVITGGTSVKDANKANGTGGNIRIAGNNADSLAQLTLLNTTVSDGQAKSSGKGLYMADATYTRVTLSGKVIISDGMYMAGTDNVICQDMTEDSQIKIGMKTAGIIGSANTDVSACFQSVNTDLQVFYDSENGKLYLAAEEIQPEDPEEPVAHTDHCICAGSQVTIEGHTCQNVTWTALTQSMFDSATADSAPVKLTSDGYVLATGGHYYLQENIAITKSVISAPGEEVALCLNGKTFHGDGVRTLYFQGTLHLCDCGYTDETVDEITTRTYAGSVTTTSKAHAHIFYARSGASFYFYGGNLSGGAVGKNFTANSGTGTVGGTMHMYGGVITGGDCTANGKSGGNVRVDGTFEMYAGLISGGKAKEGGNIAIASAGNMRMQGGIIEAGEAASGGNIAAFGTLTLAGDATIRNGVSTGTGTADGGGNIYGYPNKVDISVEGGIVENGKAAKYGANIFLRGNSNGTNKGKLTLTGGVIRGVAAGSGSDTTSVYIMKNKGLIELYVGGNAQVDEICLDASNLVQIAQSGITQAASVGVSLAAGNGVVGTRTEAEVDYTAIFYATENGKVIRVVDGQLVIEDET